MLTREERLSKITAALQKVGRMVPRSQLMENAKKVRTLWTHAVSSPQKLRFEKQLELGWNGEAAVSLLMTRKFTSNRVVQVLGHCSTGLSPAERRREEGRSRGPLCRDGGAWRDDEAPSARS